MAGIFLGETLSEKHVSQMGTTPMTPNLRPLTIWIGESVDRVGNLVIKARPSALCIELIEREIQRRITPSANKNTRLCVTIILTTPRIFCSTVHDNPFFFWNERMIPFHGV
jgi:hypothetical protein